MWKLGQFFRIDPGVVGADPAFEDRRMHREDDATVRDGVAKRADGVLETGA